MYDVERIRRLKEFGKAQKALFGTAFAPPANPNKIPKFEMTSGTDILEDHYSDTEIDWQDAGNGYKWRKYFDEDSGTWLTQMIDPLGNILKDSSVYKNIESVEDAREIASSHYALYGLTILDNLSLKSNNQGPLILGLSSLNSGKILQNGEWVNKKAEYEAQLAKKNYKPGDFNNTYDSLVAGKKYTDELGLIATNIANGVMGLTRTADALLTASGAHENDSEGTLKVRAGVLMASLVASAIPAPYGTVALGVLQGALLGDSIMAKAGIGNFNDKFSVDKSTIEKVGGSYGGSIEDINNASELSGKRHGFFGIGGKKAKKRDNAKITEAKRLLNIMRGIADEATDQKEAAAAMSDIASLQYETDLSGGYDLRYMRAAKEGGTLEQLPKFTLIPTFKSIELPKFQPILLPTFKIGGLLEKRPEELEDTTLKNIIPEGALHKELHHMDDTGMDTSEITKKGIPVVDNNGEQQAEIELNEWIMTLELTKFVEEKYKKFYNKEISNSEKEELAFECGKELVYQLLYNTEDRTGLISTLKRGGNIPDRLTSSVEKTIKEADKEVKLEEAKILKEIRDEQDVIETQPEIIEDKKEPSDTKEVNITIKLSTTIIGGDSQDVPDMQKVIEDLIKKALMNILNKI